MKASSLAFAKALVFVGIAAMVVGCSSIRGGDAPLEVIDCHTHFYDPARPEGVPWPGKTSSLYRTVLPHHFRAQAADQRVTGTVIVEASSWLKDNDWLLDLAKNDPFIVGIVGRLDPLSSDFATHATRLAANPLYRGIRVSMKTIQKSMASKDLKNYQVLADLDLSLDINGVKNSGEMVAELAQLVPNLRIIVNHSSNVVIAKSGPVPPWKASVIAAASQPNVYCKISGLVEGAGQGGADTAPDDLAFYKPTIDVVWDAFGEDRVIYGSNWPVCDRAGPHELVQRIMLSYTDEKGEMAKRKYFSGNAKRAYKWLERPGRLTSAE